MLEAVSKKKKIALTIICCWAMCIPIGGFFAYKYLGNTGWIFHAPEGTPVAIATDAINQYMTTQVVHDPLYLLFDSLDGQPLINDNSTFKDLSHYLMETFSKEHYAEQVFSLNGYYFPPDLQEVRDQFVGLNSSRSLIIADLRKTPTLDMMKFHPEVSDLINRWIADHNATDKLTFRTTSVQQVVSDLESGLLGDLIKIDAITFPFAVGAMAYCVRSVRMLVIPMICVFVTFCTALGLMYPVSLGMTVSSFAPELSAAIMIAVTVDYCLFILSRFTEQVKYQEASRGDRSEETRWIVATNTAKMCAENILVSGLTIAAALGGLGLMPVGFLASVGVAFCISCIVAIIVSLTLIPALLFIFYEFFRVPATMPEPLRRCWASIRGKKEKDDEERASLLENGNNKKAPEGTAEAEEGEKSLLETHQEQQRKMQYSSFWFKMGRLAFRRPIIVSLVVCVLGIPLFYFASELQTNFNLFNQVPRGSPHGAVLKEIVTTVGDGMAIPYFVIINTGEPDGIWTNEAFKFTSRLVENIHIMANQPKKKINGFAYANGQNISSLTQAQKLYKLFPPYQMLFNHTVDETRQVGILFLTPPFDPFGEGVNEYLNNVYDSISLTQFQLDCNYTVGFTGSSAPSWQIMREVMNFFPIQIGITFAIIFVFIGVVFRSVFIPIRMCFTVAYTVGAAFGVGVIVFQYTWSHHIWTAMHGVNGYVYLVPIMSFSLLCALGLDYDVFLITRIIEMKRIGFDDEAAISKGVWKTGRIISFAGVIMAISFGSLTLSNTQLLNEFGFVCLVAVLVDTFVIRPLFTPGLMSIIPQLSWWPRKFTNTLTVDDMDEEEKKVHM